MQSVLGIAGLLFVAWLFSEARRAVPWRAVAAGLALVLALALLFLKLPAGSIAGTLATCLIAACVGLIV